MVDAAGHPVDAQQIPLLQEPEAHNVPVPQVVPQLSVKEVPQAIDEGLGHPVDMQEQEPLMQVLGEAHIVPVPQEVLHVVSV
jgi:hypothetical protein